MENDLIFGAESSDALFGAAADVTQIAAVATPLEEPMPTPRDAAQVVVPQGQTVIRVPVAPGEVVELPFPADAHFQARLEDGNLAIKVGDLTIILQGYAEAAGQAMPVIEAANGQPLDIAAILAATDPGIDIETAAGPAGAQGQGADNTGALLTQFAGAGGGLGGFTGVGGQDGSDSPSSGPGVDQTGTLFKQFGDAPIPTAPTAPDFTFTTNEDSGITRKVVATDPQGDALTYALVGAKPAGLTFNPDGTWTFDPAGKYDQLNTPENPGQVSFQYKANDGANDSNVATVTIDIDGVNDAPVLHAGAIIGRGFGEDEPNHSEILNWIIDDPDDTVHTITVDSSTLPPGVTFDPDTRTIHYDTAGQYDYLAAGKSESFTIKFTITDAHGGSVEQNFTLGIAGVNDVPVATNDTILTNAGALGTFNVPDWVLLVNDKDVDSTNLNVFPMFPGTGLESLGHIGGGIDNHFVVEDDETLGGSFEYKARDGIEDSNQSNTATASIQNQERGDITGTDTDEILIGRTPAQTIEGAGGNDILIGSASGINRLFGGSGDDVIVAISDRSVYDGGTDTVALSGGLAAAVGNHGDVLAVQNAALDLVDFVDAVDEGIETISTQAKFGGVGAQSLTVNAASVRQLSDHTITPGGGFLEHDAIRIDGDSVDQLTLSSDGGKWVDTSIEMAGYRVYAHETSAGDPASTDAYVMVQAANTGNVHLNPPVAGDDRILTTVGTNTEFSVPEWALLANDRGDKPLDVAEDIWVTDNVNYIVHETAPGTNGFVAVGEDAAPGGSFEYQATDGETLSKSATVSIYNSAGAFLDTTDADEILVGSQHGERLDGKGGNDIIFGGGGEDEIYGGEGDDIIALDPSAGIDGGTDNVASSGGLAAGADNHGDVLIRATNFSLVDATNVESVETISTQEKFGGVGAQTVTLDAGSVQQLSDHTITPGGGFGEHDAIRIDGDSADQLYLTTGKDGGQWVDTAIEVAGYRVYAHETGGDAASTDAYVMVQAANVGNVHLNQDGAPVAVDDTILTNLGNMETILLPEWVVLVNDKTVDGANLDVAEALYGSSGLNFFDHSLGVGSNGKFFADDDGTLGGSFEYKATDGGGVESQIATATIQNQAGGDITGTDADEILFGKGVLTFDGAGGNDILIGSADDFCALFGGSGDDILVGNNNRSFYNGDTDTVASSGGLAAAVGNHGDVLAIGNDAFDLVDVADKGHADGIETVSTQEKFGGVGVQTLIIEASSVQQISNHTITPGGIFAEHEAIRIDGDIVDQLYLSLSKDGGQWVDTSIETAGYHIFAHEATAGDAASTDAYVMVQAANVGNVRLAPVAGNDTVLTNVGAHAAFKIPEWALLANDAGTKLDVDVDFYGTTGFDLIAHAFGTGSTGVYTAVDNETLGAEFGYKATDGIELSATAIVDIQNQAGGDISGTDAGEILIGTASAEKIDGGGGNDIIFSVGGSGDEIFGGAGDDIVDFVHRGSSVDGGTDTVALRGGLAADADNHGDVLIRRDDLDLAISGNASDLHGIETISTQEKFGAVGAQTIEISAASVQQLSDHTVTPGGVFAEHEAIRIDGDFVDQLYLSISRDGGKWVDTSIEAAGYHIFAHETTAGDAASTDAYVMVQANNAGNVQLNQDAP